MRSVTNAVIAALIPLLGCVDLEAGGSPTEESRDLSLGASVSLWQLPEPSVPEYWLWEPDEWRYWDLSKELSQYDFNKDCIDETWEVKDGQVFLYQGNWLEGYTTSGVIFNHGRMTGRQFFPRDVPLEMTVLEGDRPYLRFRTPDGAEYTLAVIGLGNHFGCMPEKPQ